MVFRHPRMHELPCVRRSITDVGQVRRECRACSTSGGGPVHASSARPPSSPDRFRSPGTVSHRLAGDLIRHPVVNCADRCTSRIHLLFGACTAPGIWSTLCRELRATAVPTIYPHDGRAPRRPCPRPRRGLTLGGL